MAETRKIAAILAADVVGFSRMTNAAEDRTLARLRTLRTDLIDPTVVGQNGRVFKRTGDGALVEFRSVVEAVRCAITVQNAMIERNAGLPPDQRIEFRIGIHLGDVVEESDGDLMGDGVNIAARLEGIAAPGAICMSEDAYRQVKGRLELAVSDLGPIQLKNIAEPVRAYSLQVGVPAVARPASPSEQRKSPVLAWLVGGLVALVAMASGTWYFLAANHPTPAQAKTEPAHLSLVVLPFTNLSGDRAQDYFADGVTDNLTTELARIRDSFVIARNTAFTFKGKAVDAREIGRELGVRYVLEGSVLRDQGRVRVNAQLIDAQSGAHIWADRFEEDVADLFKLQDEVVGRLANSLGNELVKAEARGDSRITHLDAFDLTMRGRAAYFESERRPTKEKNLAARALFEQALAINPENASALAGDAATYVVEKSYGWTSPNVDYDAKIVGQLDRSIAIDPDDPRPYRAKGLYLSFVLHHAEEGQRAIDAGLALNPGSAFLYGASGVSKIQAGKFAEAKSDVLRAIQLSPRDPDLGVWFNELSSADIGLGHFDDAINESNRAIDEGLRTFIAYTNLATAYAMTNRIDEAKAAVATALKFNPKLTVKYMSELYSKTPAVAEGLRKAGLSEG